jgi:hypothetical protein
MGLRIPDMGTEFGRFKGHKGLKSLRKFIQQNIACAVTATLSRAEPLL